MLEQGLYQDKWRGKKNGPPNLDELLSEFMKSVFGESQSSGSGQNYSISSVILIVVSVIAALWAVSGFYIVSPAEEAVTLRFGRYTGTVGPGLHWYARGFESKRVVNTSKVESYEYSSRMLTEDENYAKASIIVYYRITNPRQFFFNLTDPILALERVVASSLRQVVGHTRLQGLLTTEKEAVRIAVGESISEITKRYQSGIEITDVKLQEITVPSEVLAYFDDVIKAREEKAKKISQGERYVREIIPLARGQAERNIRSAEAYKEKVVLDARAGVARFLALLSEYQANPELTEKRLFTDTMIKIMSKLNKVYLDGSKQILYLPLDKSSQPEAIKSLMAKNAG